MNDKPLALDAYETLAEAYAAVVDTKPHNAYYERPATLSLLPEIEGKTILDAGCGPGVYSEWLIERGARRVFGIDASPKMLKLARQRLGGAANVEFREANMNEPLDFIESESFDLVLSPLAVDYVADWRGLFREFYRVLRAGGHFVFSIHHPFFDYQYFKSDNYFRTEIVGVEWKGFGEVRVYMPSYRRPLEEAVNPLVEAGFRLEKILEPKATEKLKETDPKHYAELSREPCFLCIRAKR
ncbi:MAG: class I SAM-dependent methyltransferase [Acidobacteriota bacterium]|nr:class I SAM-dependent methyltransferase [Acidobacteriota bacterium]